MKPLPLILSVLLIAGLTFLYFHKQSGHNQKLQEKDKAYELQYDSLNKAWSDSLHSRELKALDVFQEYVRKLDKMEGDRDYWKRKALHENSITRHFTDFQTDSLLQSVR